MNQKRKALINEYRDYLVMLNIKTTEVNMSIKTIEDINRYKEECIGNLNDLEKLNKEIKLYEKDYDNFRISMGKFAIGLIPSAAGLLCLYAVILFLSKTLNRGRYGYIGCGF